MNAISLFRQPQVRWTKKIHDDTFFAVSVENPSPDVTGASGVSQVPDVVARVRLDNTELPLFGFLAKGGHLQAAVLAREIRAEPPDRPNETVATGGVGANMSGQMFTKWNEGRDNFTFALNGGIGIGRYITDLGTLGGQDAVYNAETNSLESLPVFASYVGYQHWWTKGVRSTWTYGFVNVSNLPIQIPESLHRTHRFTTNVAWSPILRLDLVFEYLAGTRENKDGKVGFPTSSKSVVRFDSDSNPVGPDRQ